VAEVEPMSALVEALETQLAGLIDCDFVPQNTLT
jgi:hypothetical protein